jgi:hypothetical protein
VGSGESLAAKKVGKIPGTMIDRHGGEVGKGMMTDVSHLPGGAFN